MGSAYQCKVSGESKAPMKTPCVVLSRSKTLTNGVTGSLNIPDTVTWADTEDLNVIESFLW